jgi:hypothetical protein
LEEKRLESIKKLWYNERRLCVIVVLEITILYFCYEIKDLRGKYKE